MGNSHFTTAFWNTTKRPVSYLELAALNLAGVRTFSCERCSSFFSFYLKLMNQNGSRFKLGIKVQEACACFRGDYFLSQI